MPVILFLVSTPALAFELSQQAQTSLSIIHEAYQHALSESNPNPGEGGDITQACIVTIFREWAIAYLDILDHTPDLDISKVGIPLIAFGRDYFDSERNLKVYEYFRKDLNHAVQDQLRTVRQQNGSPPSLQRGQLKLDNIEDKLFLSNIKLCGREEVIEAIMDQSKELNLNLPFPTDIASTNHGKVTWIQSPNGGIRVLLTNGDMGLANHLSGEITHIPSRAIENREFGPIPSSFSYTQFLTRVTLCLIF